MSAVAGDEILLTQPHNCVIIHSNINFPWKIMIMMRLICTFRETELNSVYVTCVIVVLTWYICEIGMNVCACDMHVWR